MLETELIALIDPVLRGLGCEQDEGFLIQSPPLDVERLDVRSVRLSRWPLFGRSASVVALARQTPDLATTQAGHRALLGRLSHAVSGRYAPWRAWSIGLTTLVLTRDEIGPGDDAVLKEVLDAAPRVRTVSIGLIRLNLQQEAMAMALARGPGELFPEPLALADALAARLRRFVPLVTEESG